MALTADGQHAVSASQDHTLRVWDMTSGQCLQVLSGHTEGVISVTLTADGQRAVSVSRDHVLRAWNLASEQSEKALPLDDALTTLGIVGKHVVIGDQAGQDRVF